MARKGIVTVTGEQSNDETSYLEIFNLKSKDYYSIDFTRNTCMKTPNIALGLECVNGKYLFCLIDSLKISLISYQHGQYMQIHQCIFMMENKLLLIHG